MADFKQNYFQRRTKDRGPRSNNRIISSEVQVITNNGENLGILNLNEAITKAKNEGLDLIEIAPNAKPPVCKIMDMGKYKYDQQPDDTDDAIKKDLGPIVAPKTQTKTKVEPKAKSKIQTKQKKKSTIARPLRGKGFGLGGDKKKDPIPGFFHSIF